MAFQYRKPAFLDLTDTERQHGKYLLFVLLVSNLLIAAPCVYLVSHNYNIFMDIAESSQIFMLKYMHRERIWLYMVIGGGLILNQVLSYYVISRFLRKFSSPLSLLQNHLDQVSQGNYEQRPLFIRSSDELHQIVSLYNKVYKDLKNRVSEDNIAS